MADGDHDLRAALKDLRGQEYRSVHRDDAVIISGAEYLRKSMALSEAEFAAARIRSEAERETVQRIVARLRADAADCEAHGKFMAAGTLRTAADNIKREFGSENEGEGMTL